MKNASPEPDVPAQKPSCFVIMPISDPKGYSNGHFRHVYDDMISPACNAAGFCAIRADEVKESNLIHLDILMKLLETPMAVCDLSSRNPNVLFELALRQAFDKPVALVQEMGTDPIFDTGLFRSAEYRKELLYHEVLEDQKTISEAIRATFEKHKAGEGVNSIVKLLALNSVAKLPAIEGQDVTADLLQVVLAEVRGLRDEVLRARHDGLGLEWTVARKEALNSLLRRLLPDWADKYILLYRRGGIAVLSIPAELDESVKEDIAKTVRSELGVELTFHERGAL